MHVQVSFWTETKVEKTKRIRKSIKYEAAARRVRKKCLFLRFLCRPLQRVEYDDDI